MRKNKLTGAIPNAGRKKGNDDKVAVHLTITKKAKMILDKQLRMDKGNFVSGLIEGSEICEHPRDKRTYIGEGYLRCGVCKKEFK